MSTAAIWTTAWLRARPSWFGPPKRRVASAAWRSPGSGDDCFDWRPLPAPARAWPCWRTGHPLPDALSLTAASVNDIPIRSGLLAARQAVETDGSLTRSREPFLTPLLWQVLNVGSLTGTFAAMVREMGGCSDAELELRHTARGAAGGGGSVPRYSRGHLPPCSGAGCPWSPSWNCWPRSTRRRRACGAALTRPPADRGFRLTDLLIQTGLFDEWHLDVLDTAETSGRLDEGFGSGKCPGPSRRGHAGRRRPEGGVPQPVGGGSGPGRPPVFRNFNQPFSQLLAGRGVSGLDAALLDAGEAVGQRAAALAEVEGLHALYRELPDTLSADDCCFLAGWAATWRLGIGIDAAFDLLETELPRMALCIQFLRHAIGGDPERLTPKRLVRAGLAPWLAAGIAAGAAGGRLGDALERLVACERIRLRRRRAPLLRGGPIRRRAALAHTSRVLGTLLGLGAPFEEALDAAAASSGERTMGKVFRRVYLTVAREHPVASGCGGAGLPAAVHRLDRLGRDRRRPGRPSVEDRRIV